MELREITDPEEQREIIDHILRTLVSTEEIEEILEPIISEIEYGSKLFAIFEENKANGFFIVSENEVEDAFGKMQKAVNISEVWFSSGTNQDKLAQVLGGFVKQIGRSMKAKIKEIVLMRDYMDFGDNLIREGYVCEEIKLEKMLPNASNLRDVLELIHDELPNDIIIEVLLEKDGEYMTDFIETIEEVQPFIKDGWDPLLVVVTFEPDNQNYKEIIEKSDAMLKWDDFEITYRL